MPNSPSHPLLLAILLAYLVALAGCDSHLPSQTPSTAPRPAPVPVPSPQLSQARTLLIQGDHRRAADLYRQTLDSHPGSVPAYIGLAQASLRLSNFPAAIAACTTGLKRDSTALELFNLLAAAYSAPDAMHWRPKRSNNASTTTPTSTSAMSISAACTENSAIIKRPKSTC